MDVVVVGAGPAGLMVAEVCALAGHRVVVYDARRSPARKFVLAGRGGLNITHSEPIELLLDRYGPERPFLEPAIAAFTPDDLRDWCKALGHETFVGTSGRVFPKELRAVPLLRSWLRRLEELGVDFRLGTRWVGWHSDDHFAFEQAGAEVEVPFDAGFLALGGASWPRVSSDGSWRHTLENQGVDVSAFHPANCGIEIKWSDVLVDRFGGVPIKNAAVAVREVATGDTHVRRGDPIVTTRGLEGGPIYGLSRVIRENLSAGEPRIEVDLFPDVSVEALAQRLASRSAKESTARWLRRHGVSAVAASLLREVSGNALPREPHSVAALAKALPLRVDALSSLDRSISTAGGVAWDQIDADFELLNAPNVFVVGEMLNWEAPTGGYLLQGCFSTAYFAATRWCARCNVG